MRLSLVPLLLTLILGLAGPAPAPAQPALVRPPPTGMSLKVGPAERFTRPSEAAANAREGDTVLIAPGQYTDCAIWRTPGVTIAAAPGGPVVISGPICGGKALFVIAAPRITITGLTFRGAGSPEGNGAGIRAEGGDLTIRRSRFEGNENGILAASTPAATMLIEDSVFIGNGALLPGHACAHGIYVNALARLTIRRSRFEGTRVCHHVKSRAARTEVLDSQILDTPEGNASYLIDVPNGGDLLVRGNTLRKGPRSGNWGTTIAIGLEGVTLPTNSLRVEGNRFENLLAGSTVFVRNRSATPAELVGNTLSGTVVPLEGPGAVEPASR
jgi:hypothetical protein